MIKVHGLDASMSRDKCKKAKMAEYIANRLEKNHKKLQSRYREWRMNPLDIAEKAYQQTVFDLQSEGLLVSTPETDKSLSEQLSNNEET
jgi:chemotaxis regulatin CheY-phosphate phosphatase CheZ